MIARGFKPVAWVAGIGGAALSCYMLSLQVAAERADLAGVERKIILAQQQIRSLQTELGTRGRLQQLEQWNAEVLALSAPVAGQFLESNVSLARFDVRQPRLEDQGEMRMASAETPAATQPAAVQPPVRLASAETPAVPAPAARPTSEAPPLVRRASLETAVASRAPLRPAAVQARAMLDDETLDDLGVEARSERDGGARN